MQTLNRLTSACVGLRTSDASVAGASCTAGDSGAACVCVDWVSWQLSASHA